MERSEIISILDEYSLVLDEDDGISRKQGIVHVRLSFLKKLMVFRSWLGNTQVVFMTHDLTIENIHLYAKSFTRDLDRYHRSFFPQVLDYLDLRDYKWANTVTGFELYLPNVTDEEYERVMSRVNTDWSHANVKAFVKCLKVIRITEGQKYEL